MGVVTRVVKRRYKSPNEMAGFGSVTMNASPPMFGRSSGF